MVAKCVSVCQLLLLASLAHADSVGTDLNSADLRMNLLHSFDQGRTWKERGTINLPASGLPPIYQEASSSQGLNELRELCDRDQLYLLKVISEGSGFEHRTFGSACRLLEANLVDFLHLHLDWRGNLAAVNLIVAPPSVSKDEVADEKTFRTKVITNAMENGPAPDTAAYIQRVEEEKVRSKTGEGGDNRSFLAKYWMYIVPVFIFMVINSAASPDNGGR
uniref:ER membrane protein complex subunit 10 n=1 Tax=Pseudodiaptomus poplesia TaxID=213370 RepID=A0A1S6GL76_9MAXI|nr:ER membrane protein complex subunit 10 [Pseudodiaptomus poplesia]